MVELLNKKKIKRLIAQGNRLEAMDVFLQSKFGETPKQYIGEEISNDCQEEGKSQNINKKIDDNIQAKEASIYSTNNKEDIAEVEVDVETVDPLTLKEKTLTAVTCQTSTSGSRNSYLDASHQISTKSDVTAIPQADKQITAQCMSVNQLPESMQMSSSFSNAGHQTMISQQLSNNRESPQQCSLVDYRDVSNLSQYGNSGEVPYASYSPQVVQYSLPGSYGNHTIRPNNWELSPQEQQHKQQAENDCGIHPSIPVVSHLDRKNQSALDTLKKNNQKDFRDQGRPYISRATGKEIKGRAMGPPCKCKKRCWSRVEAGAEEIFIAFWDMGNLYEQNVYLYGNISINPVRRHYVKGSNRRTYTFKYWVKVRGKHVEVCKETFMGVHGLQNSRGRINNLMKQMKEGNMLPKADQRGKHSNRPNKYTEQVLKCAQRHIETFIHQNITLRVLYRDYYLPWCEEQKISVVSEDKYRRLYSGNNKIS